MTEIPSHKLMTLCLIYTVDTNQILLGMKKRGFGQGRWNGFGGKVHDGESVKQAALRELHEEVSISPQDLKERGVLLFEFQGNPQKLAVHLFSAHRFSGEPSESEEMRPQWFDLDKIPYDTMWSDDRFWLPRLLEGNDLKGYFLFDSEDNVLKQELTVLHKQ